MRADSGLEIGTGHVMRCLTLAQALHNNGHEILFISKPHDGNIISKIKQSEFEVSILEITDTQSNDLLYSRWLGGCQDDDAKQTVSEIYQYFGVIIDLIIVDHYAIDYRWEEIVKQQSSKIFVIDDLADRKHNCDYLLDQTFMRNEDDYRKLTPKHCQKMLGTQFALLRQEFIKPLANTLQVRNEAKKRHMERVLVMMGGTDHLNISEKILGALLLDKRTKKVTVVLGPTAPHYQSIKAHCELDTRVTLLSDTPNVAELMLEHDICFGAAGTASWERCSLGLPSILVAFAENQTTILSMLKDFGAASVFAINDNHQQILSKINYLRNPEAYQQMVNKCLEVCDGKGTMRVIGVLTK